MKLTVLTQCCLMALVATPFAYSAYFEMSTPDATAERKIVLDKQKTLTDKIRELKDLRDTAKDRFNDMKNKRTQLQKDINTMRENFKTAIADAKEKIKTIKNDATTEVTKLQAMGKNLDDKKEIDSLNSSIDAYSHEIDKAMDALAALNPPNSIND